MTTEREQERVLFETERLRFYAPGETFLAPMVAVFGDAATMEFIGDGTAWSRERVARLLVDLARSQEEHGFALWPVRLRENGACIGDCGLCLIQRSGRTQRGPEVELGYHLHPAYWGKGYATEAAMATLDYAFETLGLEEILAVTAPTHLRSQRVLQKCGMQPRAETEDFYDKRLLLFAKQNDVRPRGNEARDPH